MPAAIPAVAAIGGALISSSASSKASKRAASSEAAALGFEQQKYDDWQQVFGPLQDNLAKYYNSVSPDYYASAGLEAFQKERTQQLDTMTEQLAQRGLQGSGLEASLKRSTAIDTAEKRAAIRVEAPKQAAEDKTRFLQIGLGQNPGASYSAALGNIANNANTNAQQAQLASGQATAAAVNTAGTALSDYFNKDKA